MLTEQQLAILRSAPSTNRVAKAIWVAGVTQVNVADAVGLPQPYVSDVARQRYRTITLPSRTRGSSSTTSVAPSRICSRHPVDNDPEVTRNGLRTKLLADTILGTDTAFDLIEEIAAIPGVKWSHAPCIGLRGSIRGAVAPLAERIRGADPETEEPFESPMDGRSLRWKEEELALCPIAIREWHANNVDDMMMLRVRPHGAVGRGIQSMVGEVPRCAQETGSLRALARARSHDPLDADHSRCR